MTGGACAAVDGDGAPVSCVGVLVDWTGAGLDVAGSPVAGLELTGVLDGSTDGAGSDVAGGGGPDVLDGCVTGSAGGVGVDVG